ncbi:MAG: hypothetical protein HZB43_09605, partial [candidate division Zixibacteria bacterium]|nr:hypothetical protein [candidate division Zixibacteria bacterium]
ALGLVPNRIRLAGTNVLVVNSISDGLWVLDATTLDTLRTIKFPDGDNPWDVTFVNDTLCAVSMLLANDVVLVNQTAGTILGTVPVGTSPEGLIYAAGKIWVANSGFSFVDYTYGAGTVSVINPVTHAVVTTIPVGTNPQSLALSPDGTIHVMCTGNYVDRTGIVYVLSASGLNVTDSILLGGAPGDLVIAGDGMGYLAAGGWADSGLVFRYNALSHMLLNGAANPWHSARGVTAVLPRLEGGVYTMCFDADSVVEHRLNGAVVRAWQVGDGPQAAISISNRVPGDSNDDGAIDVFDVIAVIDIAFGGLVVPHPNSADVNTDCVIDVFDVIELVAVAFSGGKSCYWGCAQ